MDDKMVFFSRINGILNSNRLSRIKIKRKMSITDAQIDVIRRRNSDFFSLSRLEELCEEVKKHWG